MVAASPARLALHALLVGSALATEVTWSTANVTVNVTDALCYKVEWDLLVAAAGERFARPSPTMAARARMRVNGCRVRDSDIDLNVRPNGIVRDDVHTALDRAVVELG